MGVSLSGARASMPYRLVNNYRPTSSTCVSLGMPIDSAPSTNRGQNGCCLIAVIVGCLLFVVVVYMVLYIISGNITHNG